MNEYDNYFLPLADRAEQEELFKKLIDACFNFYSGETRDGKVLNYRPPEVLKEIAAEDLPIDGTELREAISTLEEQVGKYSVAQFDDTYLAFPDSGNAIPAIWADIYSKFINQNLIAVSRSAPIATFIEIQLLEWLRQIIGYEYKSLRDIHSLSEVSGMVTTGGHMSNHVAIMAALNKTFPEIKKGGLSCLTVQPAVILAGAISHYSFSSALHHLGIGQDALLDARSSNDYTTNLEDVERLLTNPPEGKQPFMVVGVAGNSRTTSLDDLSGLSALCKKYNVWFHTDACHGGALLFSSEYRKLLARIEESDSVSIDPHKGLFAPYPLSFVLFKERDTLTKFTRYESEVRDGSSWDLGYITPFYGSRGFESLKLWLTIKTLGMRQIEQIIDDRQEIAHRLSKYIASSKFFTILNDMTFYRMVFLYYPEDVKQKLDVMELTVPQKVAIKRLIDQYTHAINEELYVTGSLCLDEFKLDDLGNRTKLDSSEKFVVMSVTVGNPKQSTEKINVALQKLFTLCEARVSEFEQAVNEALKDDNINEHKPGALYGPAGW
jgi:glutamate/tyrosine decarboxylase-like PLP-dependent enzyme